MYFQFGKICFGMGEGNHTLPITTIRVRYGLRELRIPHLYCLGGRPEEVREPMLVSEAG
jgi:hypothetical protein